MKRKSKALLQVGKAQTGLKIARVSDLVRIPGFDLDKLAEDFIHLDQEVWGNITNSQYMRTVEMVKNQFRVCPHLLYCAFHDGKLVGTAGGIFTDQEEMSKNKTWLEKTGKGYFNTHIPNGHLAFGADLSVLKTAPKRTGTQMMLTLLIVTIIGENMKALYLGSRIPGYQKRKDLKIEEYVYGKRPNGKPLDPELNFYLKDGFEIVEIIPEYMDDPDSLNYGVLIKWDNPLYKVTKAIPFLKSVIRWIGKKLLLRIPS